MKHSEGSLKIVISQATTNKQVHQVQWPQTSTNEETYM